MLPALPLLVGVAVAMPDPRMEALRFDPLGRATVEIVNRGTTPIGGRGGISLYVDGHHVEHVRFEGWDGPADPEGEQPHVIQFSSGVFGGEHHILIRVDPGEELDELSEVNNLTSFRRTFLHFERPDLEAEPLAPPEAGLEVELDAGSLYGPLGPGPSALVEPLPPPPTHAGPERAVALPALLGNPRIQRALVWRPLGGTPVAYPDWPRRLKDLLAEHYRAIAAGRDPLGHRPPYRNPVGYVGIRTKLTPEEAAQSYVEHVALALWLEDGHRVPWSLLDLTDEQLGHLLRADSLIIEASQRTALPTAYFTTDPTQSKTFQRSAGGVSDWSAVVSYRFLANAGLIGPTPLETVTRIIDWARGSVVHAVAGRGTPVEHWGLPHQTIEGVLYPPYGWSSTVSGCTGNVGLLKALLRSVNIPVLHHGIALAPNRQQFHEGVIATEQHSRISFPTLGLQLAHGDDILWPAPILAVGHPAYPSLRILYTDAQWADLQARPPECARFTCRPDEVDPRCGSAPFCNPPEWQFDVERARHRLADRLASRDLSLLREQILGGEPQRWYLDDYCARPALTAAEQVEYAAALERWLQSLTPGDRAADVAFVGRAAAAGPMPNPRLHR